MNISVEHPQLIHIPRVSFDGLRLVFCAAALYSVCVVTPAIYSATRAIRSYHEQTMICHELQFERLSITRQRHKAVLREANQLESTELRAAFLEKAIARARCELDGLKLQLALDHASHETWNTPFNRLLGNKMLACTRQELQHSEWMQGLGVQYVADLTHALHQAPQSDPVLMGSSPSHWHE